LISDEDVFEQSEACLGAQMTYVSQQLGAMLAWIT
jgi:hypothetical protein